MTCFLLCCLSELPLFNFDCLYLQRWPVETLLPSANRELIIVRCPIIMFCTTLHHQTTNCSIALTHYFLYTFTKLLKKPLPLHFLLWGKHWSCPATNKSAQIGLSCMDAKNVHQLITTIITINVIQLLLSSLRQITAPEWKMEKPDSYKMV